MAESKDSHGKDIEFHPKDNCYLVVHEFLGFESQHGDSQNLWTIQEFISYRLTQAAHLLKGYMLSGKEVYLSND